MEQQKVAQDALASLPSELAHRVNAMLSSATDKAAGLLTQKLAEANEAAVRARDHYERAVELSFWRVAACSLIGCAFGVAAFVLLALTLLPDASVMQKAKEAQRVVAALEPRGGNAVLTQCQDGQVERLCIRTDERKEWHRGTETYRVIYGY